MKGFGDSKSPLYFVAVAAVINVFLDFIFVGPMGMGIKGLRSFAVQKEKLIIILKVGLPTALQMVIINISYLLITGMLNTFGVSVAAASGIGLKVNTFAGMPCWAIGQAVTAMAGQNKGAQDTERVKKTTRYGLLINTFATFLTVVLVQIFAEAIIMLFDPAGTEVITEGVMYLRICCSINSLVYAVMYTLDSFAIGAGSANIAMCNAFLDAVIVRLPVCWLLAFPMQMGAIGVYIGQALAPILPALAGIVYFKSKFWETKKLIGNTEYYEK